MIAELGAFLAILGLVASLLQGVCGLYGGHRGDVRWGAAGAACAQIAAASLALAFAALIAAFVRSDFSLAVVAANSHTDKPLLYRIAGAWGNHEGSMLLWCFVSALFGFAMAQARGAMDLGLWARAIGTQGAVTAGALIYTLALSNPFARLDPAPYQGASLNPLLQDPALAAHPPMLYLGYVGLSAPFSLAVAALLQGKADQHWARSLRPWTLLSWTFLTGGIALGAYWAYYELGWGGWWFWDPVENASFMPWLAACALVHSAIVTERRGSLAGWTILLAIGGFALALLGTFLVRSGVLTSVHTFALDPARGAAVLVLLALTVGAGLALYALRAPRLAQPTGFAPVSREGALVLNNLGFAVAAGIVLVGTLYPLAVEALTGRLVSVGPPFFNLYFTPFMAALFLLLPAAPLMTWRMADLGAALKPLLPAALASLAAAALVIATAHGKALAAIGVGVGAWLVLGTLTYLWVRWGRGGARTLPRLAALPLAVWALVAAHGGAGVFAVGAAVETSFRAESTAALQPGQSVVFAGATVTLVEVLDVRGPNYRAARAELRIERGGRARTLSAERRYYDAGGAPTTEVAILPTLLDDLYVALGEPAEGDAHARWIVRLYHNPFVRLIFIGAGLVALGGALGLAALARRRAVGAVPAGAAA
ncbi:MAG: heme lyase CcmF/NrfE family subunit [Hydrogenophilaceae bacterium]|nr:heme lyase CcmF/NrfE family subunit [Hydrogenophilaceae bacterium]